MKSPPYTKRRKRPGLEVVDKREEFTEGAHDVPPRTAHSA